MVIPNKISVFLENMCGKTDSIGLSGASVYIYDDMVLKVQAQSAESDREYDMLRWLDGRLPVPKIIEHTNANKLSYLLMQKCQGKMACDPEYMRQPIQ